LETFFLSEENHAMRIKTSAKKFVSVIMRPGCGGLPGLRLVRADPPTRSRTAAGASQTEINHQYPRA
jgi:hypothetical protein